MNRAERRAALRSARRNGHGLPKRCPPGMHAFGKIAAIVGGRETTARVVCRTCRRTFQQVMGESPEDLAMYRAFVAAEIRSIVHDRACPRGFDKAALPVSGCAGCAREAALHDDLRQLPEEASS